MSLKIDVSTSFTGLLQVVKSSSIWRIVVSDVQLGNLTCRLVTITRRK